MDLALEIVFADGRTKTLQVRSFSNSYWCEVSAKAVYMYVWDTGDPAEHQAHVAAQPQVLLVQ